MKSQELLEKIIKKEICVIYKITNLVNNKVYIGSSIRAYKRMKNNHIRNLII